VATVPLICSARNKTETRKVTIRTLKAASGLHFESGATLKPHSSPAALQYLLSFPLARNSNLNLNPCVMKALVCTAQKEIEEPQGCKANPAPHQPHVPRVANVAQGSPFKPCGSPISFIFPLECDDRGK
jgi:hypothetical protein